jgi:hypothetical protein
MLLARFSSRERRVGKRTRKVFPKMGNKFLEPNMGNSAYAAEIATALRIEVGSSHQAIKTLMRWTDVNERTAKNWLSGSNGPSGQHLMSLIHHSDGVFAAVMSLTRRHDALATDDLYELRRRLMTTMRLLDRYLSPSGRP